MPWSRGVCWCGKKQAKKYMYQIVCRRNQIKPFRALSPDESKVSHQFASKQFKKQSEPNDLKSVFSHFPVRRFPLSTVSRLQAYK